MSKGVNYNCHIDWETHKVIYSLYPFMSEFKPASEEHAAYGIALNENLCYSRSRSHI